MGRPRSGHFPLCVPGGMLARLAFNVSFVLFRGSRLLHLADVFLPWSGLFFLQRQVDVGEDVDHLITDTISQLEEAHRQHAWGCRMQANVQWAEEGEASTTYFVI